MKINFKKITNSFNFQTTADFKSDRPRRAWKAIIIISVIFAVFVFAVDGYIVWKALHVLDEKIVLEEQTAVGVNKTSLSAVVEKIKTRDWQFKKESDMIIADPSL